MIIRNPNQSDFIGKDDELSFVPFENNFIENADELSFVPSEDDEYSDYSDSDNRFIPPILNNPMGQMFFGPPGGPPGGPGGPQGGPPGPPPSGAPSKAQATSFAGGPQAFVSPGSIRPCRFQFVYIWLRNGRSFWAWLTHVDRRTAAGFRWNGRRWVYFGVDLRRIEFFMCFGRNENRQSMPPGTPFGGPPTGSPMGAGSSSGAPPGPPPSSTPKKPSQATSMAGGPQTFAVSPESIRPCLYQFVYLWLKNGRSFWAWLTNVDRRSASGFRWNGRRWVYFGVDLRRIEFFQCFGRSSSRNANLMDSDMYDDMYDNMYDDMDDNMNNSMDSNMYNIMNSTMDDTMYNNMDSTINNNMSNTMNSMGNNSDYNIGNVTIEPEKFKVEYPYVTGFENQEVQANINDAIIGEVTSLLSSQVLLPTQNTFKDIIISYQIPLKTDNLLSIVFALYTDTGGAHGNTTFSSLTFNTNTGQVYDLEDLFKPNSNYMNVLSELAVREAEEAEVPFIADYKGVSDNQQFYLTPNGIVLFYQVNEYTPYSYGLFRVTIPYDEIMGILNTNSPVYNLMAPAAQ